MAELEPTWTEATCRLGDVLGAGGDLDGALEAWGAAPWNPDCVEAAGRALLEAGRADDAMDRFETLARLTSQDPRVDLLLARALAPTDPIGAERAIDRYLARGADASDDLVPAVRAVAEAWMDQPERALALVDRAVLRQPTAAVGLREVADRFAIEVRANELMGAQPVAMTPAERAALDGARARFARGDVTEALAELEGLANQVSRSPDVWAALADVREAAGDIGGAERAIVLARRLAPQVSRFHARHGELLAEHFGGRYDPDAADLLGRALEASEDPDTLVLYAEVCGRAGRWDRASEAWARVAELGDPALTARARRAMADLGRVRVQAPELPAVPPPEGVPEEAWRATHRAWALRDRASGDPDDLRTALGELDRALALAPQLTKALNLRAQIRMMLGDRAGAIEGFRSSLAVDRDPAVLATLADLLRQDGQREESERVLAEAAAAGNGVALFRLAQRDAAEGRWWDARARLEAYFQASSSGPVHDDAIALRDRMDARIHAFWRAVAATGLAGVSGVVVLFAWWRRRRAGVGVAGLLERSPRAYRDVARVVSGIRHEVLKHNVSSLHGVADALEDGDTGPAAFAAARLYGPEGAIARFRAGVVELEELGRLHGVRLNLPWTDPVFGPLIEGFDRLAALERRLGTGGSRVVGELREIADRLGDEGYRGLGAMLQGVCVVRLGPSVFDRALDDVLGEPAFIHVERPDWSVEGPTDLAVRVFRGDLHDILVNLLRNALSASVSAGSGRLGVRLAVEEDPITGIERVEVRVRDDAPRRVSTAMIRGRYIERGLGLAVDLTSRAGGSIDVEDEPGWSKAVVVRLPLEEAA